MLDLTVGLGDINTKGGSLSSRIWESQERWAHVAASGSDVVRAKLRAVRGLRRALLRRFRDRVEDTSPGSGQQASFQCSFQGGQRSESQHYLLL